jgi:rod shape-determining protein MreD
VSYYVGISLVILAALLEASVLPLFRVEGLQPNLTLVLVIAWLMVRGADEAFVLIPVAGVFLGLVDGALMGTALLALAPIFVLQDFRGAHLSERGAIVAVVFTAIMSLVYNYTYLLVFTLQGEAGSWVEATTRVVLPATFINVAILVPIYFGLVLLNPQPRRALYA